jgi:hypothetical protein
MKSGACFRAARFNVLLDTYARSTLSAVAIMEARQSEPSLEALRLRVYADRDESGTRTGRLEARAAAYERAGRGC